MIKIKQEIFKIQSGWHQVKQVMNIIYKRTGIRYHEVYIYRLLRKWGFSAKVPQDRFVNAASKEEEAFKKEYKRKFSQIPEGFTIAVIEDG